MSKRPTPEKILLVEGKSEVGSIPEILERNGVTWSKPYPIYLKNMDGIGNINQAKIHAHLLDPRVKVLGIIIDADQDMKRAWSSIRSRCVDLIDGLPEALGADGFIGLSKRGVRFGVWVMPDNQAEGMFEDLLLASFKPESQDIKTLSERFVEEGSHLVEDFNEAHRSKSVINAWVALEEPGEPFWRPSVLERLDLTGAGMSSFVSWCKRLYAL